MKFILMLLPTILMTAYAQLIMKWRVPVLMAGQEGTPTAADRLITYLTDPYIVSAYAFSLLSSFAWMFVVERYAVSVAFPTYIGILFTVVLLGGALMLREPLTANHLIGVGLILAGVAVASRAA